MKNTSCIVHEHASSHVQKVVSAIKFVMAISTFTLITEFRSLYADVVYVTEGSTSGYTMTDGNTYIIQDSVTFSNSNVGGSGMTVADGATVVLFVPKDITLTATGANCGAGIRIPQSATLVITGEGSVVASGGNATDGGWGGNGSAAVYAYINSEDDLGGTGGAGGSGGSGGFGAGAGIGGCAKTEMGTCYLLGSITVSATGGSRGSYGSAGSNNSGARLARVKRTGSSGYWFCVAGGGGGGGGGGPGGAGASIGGGGSDGTAGSDGEDGYVSTFRFYYDGTTPPSYLYSYANGDAGSSGYAGSSGNENSGTLYVSTTTTVNANRTKLVASSHPAAQYAITFNSNGGELYSSQSNATATLGCALPDCITAPTRTEYDFCGWASSTNGGIEYYTASGDKSLSCYAVASNTTLFAQWTKTPIPVDVGGKTLTWKSIGGNVGWHMVTDETTDDGFSLRSGEIEAGTNSVVEAIFSGKGSLSFAWKIDAGRSDRLKFLLDGFELDQVPAISRSTDWVTVSIDIPSGDHTVQWMYSQSSTSGGTAWIDAVVWRPECVLTVESEWGNITPSVGEHSYLWGSEVTVMAPTSVEENGIRRICTGWMGSGNVPSTGESTNAVTFVIEESSSITWNWLTECNIEFSVEGPISTESSNQWVAQGEVATLSWTQNVEFVRLSLTGDIEGAVMDENARTLTIPADRARTLILTATETTLEGALDSRNISWSSVGERRWSPQFSDASDGVDAVISGDAQGSDSLLIASFSSAGTLSWSWKLNGSTASGIDVELDGQLVMTKDDSSDWVTETLNVTGEGQHTVRFAFWNEGTVNSDRAYLDKVEFRPEKTQTTPVPIPSTWIESRAASILATFDGDWELAANATAANNKSVWECYVAGEDPTDSNSVFHASVEIIDGMPIIHWTPDLNSNSLERIYTVWGKTNLTDKAWHSPTNECSHFFKVTVEMP